MADDRSVVTHVELQQRVDPGALALATVGGAVAFIFAGDDWDVLAVVIGLLLLTILLAHHRPAPTIKTPRALLLRGAFGATTGLAFCIAVAPAIQFGIIRPFFHSEDEEGYSFDAWNTTVALSVLWFVVAIVLAVCEPRLARWLDRPRRGGEQTPP
jgi:integral membrane sensor domain MASE1